MAITSRKITTYAKNIVDLSDQPNKDGLTAAQLKAFFDGRTDEEVKTSINGIVDDLVATTDGASGADQIGATPLTGGTGNTVQEVLEEIDGSTVHNTGDETVAGVKTFSSSPIVPTPTTDMQASTKKYVDDTDGARKTYVDNLDVLAVHLAGTETITGVKTFSASPIVPAPTTDTQASTKKYVDDADALKVNITDIVNDLTTGGTAVPLSAEQGKTLQGEVGTLASLSTTEKGSLVGAINEVDGHADTNATSIGTLASLTTTEKTNLVGAINELDTDKVETSAIVNDLTTGGETVPLSAEQGKELKTDIGNQTFTEQNYVTDGESSTASIDALDIELKDVNDRIGNQTFTEDNYVTDGASHTANIDALDMAVKDNKDLIDNMASEKIYAYDTFDRADGAIGVADSGDTWAYVGTTGTSFAISGNLATSGDVGLGGAVIDFLKDGVITVTMSTVAEAAGVVFRMTDINSYIRLTYVSGSWVLRKVISGSGTNLATIAGATNGDILKIRFVSDKIKVYINGILSATVIDPAQKTATKCGILNVAAGASLARWNDFSLEVL